MQTATQARRYSTVAIWLHWSIALLIIANLLVGSVMESQPAPLKGTLVGLHAAAGLLVLLLSVLRVIWRLMNPPPPLSQSMAWWESLSAHVAHYALYILMIGMPLAGWAILSAHPIRPGGGVTLFANVKMPPLLFISRWQDPFQKTMHDRFVDIHYVGAWILFGVLLLHIAGALKHQFIDREPEFARMGIGSNRA